MKSIGEKIQHDDWKKEKHVPVIESPEEVSAGELFDIKVGLGKEIPHPNTTEHHIRWIALYFHPENEKFTYQIGLYEFTAHGESVKGANQGPVYTHHQVQTSLTLHKSGTIYAMAYCNIHGLWENSKEIKVIPR